MMITARLVCGDCLRSVDLGARDESALLTSCPTCGGVLKSDSSSGSLGFSLRLSPDDTTTWITREPSVSLPAGSVGRFLPRERLGGGGFGDVYRAYDPHLDRDVALKVLRDDRPSPRALERFFREARAAARLDHPGIVPVLDAGRDQGWCWIAYGYVAGPTLARRIVEAPVDLETAVRIVRDLADALDHAHRRGVYHRDLKPANIILGPNGHPRLTDFGLARRRDSDPTLTQDGAVLGTLAYMSPEQAAGRSHQADARSDVYSLGVVFHELLHGHRPLAATPPSHPWCDSNGPVFRTARAGHWAIPRALDYSCRRCLAHDPADRYPNARALVDDLDRWLHARRQRAISRLGLAAGLLALTLVFGLLFGRWKPSTSPRSIPSPSSARPAVSRLTVRPRAGVTISFRASASRILHRDPACLALKSVRPQDLVAVPTPADPVADGLRACRHCGPDAKSAKQ